MKSIDHITDAALTCSGQHRVSAVCSRSLRADGLERVRGAGHEQHGVREPAEAGPREQGREVELDAARDPDHLAGVTK